MRTYGAFVLVLCSFPTLVAQAIPGVCSSTVQEPGVVLLRHLNTAEMSFAAEHQRFASVSELLSDADTKKYLHMFGSETDPLPGYTLHSVISGDGKSYVLTVTKANGDCTGFGATTYEKGVISLLEPLR